MKKVEVVAGIFIENGKLFTCQRSDGNYIGYWEFPGGKIETNETKEETLEREIFEELHAKITVDKFFTQVYYQYPDFELQMDLFLCSFLTEPKLIEHIDIKWVSKEEIDSLHWLPADVDVLPKVKELL